MHPFVIHHAVPDRTSNDTSRVRVVGLLDDGRIAVAVMTAGASQAEAECTFSVDQVVAHASACLSGDRRALTTPGLVRLLCGSLVILAKAAHASGALQEMLPVEAVPDAGETGESADDDA